MNLRKGELRKSTKTKIKRILALVLTFIMMISIIPIIDIQAITSDTYTAIGRTEGKDITDENGNTIKTRMYNIQNPDGTIKKSYCIDYSVSIPGYPIDYSIVDLEDSTGKYDEEEAKRIRAIVLNSYPNIHYSKLGIPGLTEEEAITATQIAIWHYSNDKNLPTNITGNIKTLYDRLIALDGIEAQQKTSDATITSKDLIVTKNGDKYNVEFIFEVSGKNADKSNIELKYDVKKSDGTLINYEEVGYGHIRIQGIEQGTDIKCVASGTQNLVTDVYRYKPKGNHQSMVGMQTLEKDISTMIEFYCTLAEVEIKGTKVIDGRDLKQGEFSFELLKVLNGQEESIETVMNDANGDIKFSKLSYSKPGTYQYKVKEKNNGFGGVTYDEAVFEVTVNVNDDKDGNLQAEVTYNKVTYNDDNERVEEVVGSIIFNNTYKASSTSEVIKATKHLEGRDLKEGEFEFELLEVLDDGKEELRKVVSNNADGDIIFNELVFNEAGIYTYKIREKTENLGGVIYDAEDVDVTITVTDDGKGQLQSSVSYPKKQPQFTNTYKASSTSEVIAATKHLEGRDLKEGEFEFELLEVLDNQEKSIETVKNDAAGNIIFSELKFEEVGTYQYKIREKAGNLGGITYDAQDVDITITVTDNEEGKLQANVSYPNKEPKFNNSYKAGSTSAAIEVTKKLDGKYPEVAMFSFELLDKDNNVLQTVKNSTVGKVQFASITYDAEGTYEYKVREVKENLEGIIYDENVFDVIVNVKDDINGNLVATIKYPKNNIIFENKVVKGSLEFTKTDVSTGKIIEGAHIKITCTEGLDKGKVIEFISSKEGNKFKLKAGKYTFEETQAPEGYELSTEVGTFEIKENGEVVKAELKNYPIKGSVKLIKVDKDNNEKKIEGAKFVLLAEDKETIIAENLVTDLEGKIIVTNLTPGTYYFKEIEASSGYILDDTLTEVKVEFNQSEIATVTFQNEKEKKEEVIKPVIKPNINSPQTSDTSSITGYAISGIVAVGALVGINRKRKNK